MLASSAPVGCSVLLRTGGLPVRYWLAGANPGLFEKLRRLETAEALRNQSASLLADRIGHQLVPNPLLSREDRAFLLAFRRTLHRGDPVANEPRERLLQLQGLSGADAELIQDLVSIIDRDSAIAALASEVETELVRDQERLLLLGDEIYHESPMARALLAPRGPAESGPASPLSRKSRRHRSEHEWRRIARAATGTTPREWLSHVALLPIEPADTLPAPVLTAQFTAQWMENVRSGGLALGQPPEDWPAADTQIAVNPLHWNSGESLVFMVLDETREHTQVEVRRTSLLDSICNALDDTAHTFGELATALGCLDSAEQLVLRGFVRHIVVLGILQAGAPPQVQLVRDAAPGQTFARLSNLEIDSSGWVDVYRYAETGVSASFARKIQLGVSQLLRILNLARDASSTPGRMADSTSERSWSLTELLSAEWGARGEATAKREDPAASDTVPGASDSEFATLARKIAQRAAEGGELAIDSSMLDECKAPDGTMDWPIDCLVRVPSESAGFTAVLDELLPAGMLDARFADTLADLHGIVPHLETYRAFLRQLERLTGILFVELLLPPPQDGAANAVRRPVYTSAWTGDPHTAAYLRPDARPGHYIPPASIEIRRIGGSLRAEVDGQRIWPVYHATRSFSPPWDRLARILLAAAPLELPWDAKRTIQHLTRECGQGSVPRISVSGGIVLSPAQWRVSPGQLWDTDAPIAAKVRAVVRLRDLYPLPRWVYLDCGNNKPPVACDLQSLHAIRTIERCTMAGTSINIIEMLPAPDQFPVVDRAHRGDDRLAAQLHLRFPCDESAHAMAARVAPGILAALGRPTDPPEIPLHWCGASPLVSARYESL